MDALDILSLARRAFLGSSHLNSVVTQEGLTILVVKGCIADQPVDAVVNSTGTDFDLRKGALSKVLLERAGQELQDELTASRPQIVKHGEVTVTKGHNLSASHVFHGVLKRWDNGTGDAQDVLRAFVRNSLIKASELKLKSIAIPAVGTGNLCFPGNLVVDSLFSEADKFSSTHSDTTLNEIRFIVYEMDEKVFDAFEFKMEQIKPARQEKNEIPANNSDLSDADDDGQLDISEHLRQLQSQTNKLSTTNKALEIEYPSSWKPTSQEAQSTTVLDSSDPEFKMVSKRIMDTNKFDSIRNILRIERIENWTLYQLYTVFKRDMEKRNGKDQENERFLWHGTTKESLTNIFAGGFNRSYCGKNAVKHGQGVYFARDFEYSARGAYSRPDSDGTKYIFMCSVLTGTFAVGTEETIEPDLKPGTNFRHDSTVDDLKNPTVFVVYKDPQAYPSYLVSFN